MLRVLIAEDHDDLRTALREIIDAEDDMKCVATVASPEQLVRTAASLQPDVLVLDLLLDGGSSLHPLRELRREMPELRIIVYSGYLSDAVHREARARGASAFIPKGGGFGELLAEIRRQGRRCREAG
jgi:DNA-binding NarL/FixJ family response regulator